jgi:N-acetylmuramoyl-L-alanine amidase
MRNHRAILAVTVALAALLAATAALGAPVSSSRQAKLAAAEKQYQHAQKLEAHLESRRGGTRTVAQYDAVIQSYRHVIAEAPTANLITPSLVAIARLYEEMGHLFDVKYFQKAVDTYQFLLHEYPHTRRGPEALYAIAKLEQGPLGKPALARKFLESLVRTYPSSDQADKARLELAGGDSGKTAERAAAVEKDTGERNVEPEEAAAGTRTAAAKSVSAQANAAVAGAGSMDGGKEGNHPARVRAIATSQSTDSTRVLVRLDGPVKFHAGRIPRTQRVYFDLSQAYLVHPHGERLKVDSTYLKTVRMAQNKRHVVRVVLEVGRGAAYSASLLSRPYRLAIDVGKPEAIAAGGGAASVEATREELAPRGRLTPARPTHTGATSLTRELGLKIGRIVIDAGHGGFDTGTIGPTGVEEKTVCLDVARRLGRLIQRELPGTEVVYTRDSDTFIPLQERTALANRDKADLFVSIHANSSPDHEARGVETYFLNFTTSPEAMRVAARENALSQESVHQLQDLLKKISLNDKIEESRELAADVDHSLVHQLRLGHVTTHDRGVKKAPFVVLIGAHMPSILAEISFLSNPTDERLLKKARYRQRIAQGLFNGIQRYLASLNSLSYNAPEKKPAASPR